MSSREIAELTGKQHKHVMRDIEKMCIQLEIDSAQFWAEYRDSTGRSLPCFNLDRYHAEVWVAGYEQAIKKKVARYWSRHLFLVIGY
ncbi:Rha family transcriptional regulator [Vreelandella massiliensis]|uniref:Rha family transcriptional regulator n=1 Tax=Vreelandella massiliensis TaxID=1816686 RepID=UPI001B301E40|nr:Rha family transcriptional regulator [Halomonas massiliensis]